MNTNPSSDRAMRVSVEVLPSVEAGSCNFCSAASLDVLEITIHHTSLRACPRCAIKVRNSLNDLTTLMNIKLMSFE